jgi:hypothetical protein
MISVDALLSRNVLCLDRSAQEGVFLPQGVLRSNERLWSRSRFTDETDLPQELTDLGVIARAHGRVRTAWIS